MMNLIGCLNYLRLSAKHIIKIVFFIIILFTGLNAQVNEDTTKNDTSFVMQKSPWGAVLRSAVVPGVGQIYNHSYWKAPIVWGLGVWFVYNWIQNNNKYWQSARSYQQYLNDPSNTAQTILVPAYRGNRDFYRNQRDLFTIYMGITYILQLVDAYIDAQLFDFTVQEDYRTGIPSISFRLRF
jgi:hypothetical protein